MCYNHKGVYIMIDYKKCIKCGTCAAICPVGAITMDDEGKPVINPDLCIKCGACQNSCPVLAIDINK